MVANVEQRGASNQEAMPEPFRGKLVQRMLCGTAVFTCISLLCTRRLWLGESRAVGIPIHSFKHLIEFTTGLFRCILAPC